MSKNQWVSFYTQKDKWGVKGENNQKVSKYFNTKEEAISYGKEIARKKKGQLFVKNKDQKISIEWTYGHDPRDIEG